ncbi:hypothetical protein EI42_03086 [Thermosporothrix hazakensis]|uniref:Uncharacterized protein n=1 Tax=Thermosporothrix hazakensis TaxID=644383 RepID=A0A326U4X8_THEHA|nr:hypothetical protein EI42_03086 [Thermosporothrix hazakensis]
MPAFLVVWKMRDKAQYETSLLVSSFLKAKLKLEVCLLSVFQRRDTDYQQQSTNR